MTWRQTLAFLLAISPAVAAPSPGAEPAKAGGDAAQAQAQPFAYAILRAPLFSEDFAGVPVARVERELITVRDLNEALSDAHGTRKEGEGAGKTDVLPIVDRLVDARLLVMEARNMGFDDLPETKAALESFRRSVGMDLLKDRVTKEIAPDAVEVKRLYEARVREWKARSLLFADESEAIRARAEMDAGKKFEDVAAALLAAGKATGGQQAENLPASKLLPAVLAALEKLEAGDVSPPVRVERGWAILKVEEILHPEDPKARAEVERLSATRRKGEALEKYYQGLVKRYARIDRKLLKALDFEAKRSGPAALRKDRRVLAHIQGGKPITVADLTEAVLGGFYHGAEGALQRKKVNRQKTEIFDGLLSKRIVPLEIARLGIEKTPEFERRTAEGERSLLFTRLVEQVIAPQIKVEEDAIRAYYEKNRKDFTYPAFYKLESLAFGDVKRAQAALDKLRSGTDFKWLNANAEGQVEASERRVRLEGVLAASSLPKELAEALAGARAGDHRLHADPSSQFYVVHVIDVAPAREQPLEEVRENIAGSLFYEKLNAAVKEWAAKLRKASDIQVFITKIGA
ncbi:MAG TPA: peptidylprolyl isomerase [Anaeromyxobacteraceae bacterium]|nr:peptidylprolyl isomerase [Anaeromyxobacteraceae bacterium]